MAIAGHVSRKMIERYSHIRMEAKRAALDAIAALASQAVFDSGGAQNWAHSQRTGNSPVANWSKGMVGLGRLELPTSPLSGARSNHLSYRPFEEQQ
jgi:hypothetical protein